MSRPLMRLFGLGAVLLAACGDDGPVPADTDTDTDGTAGTAGTAGSIDGPGTLDEESAGACSEPFELTCPADQAVECVGPLTPVMVETPTAACEGWMVTGEAPASLPPGDHLVEFTLQGDGSRVSCTTAVTVLDEDPPFIDCPAPGMVLRPSPDVDVAPPAANADDLCWDDVEITASPAVLGSGATIVEYTATDGSGNAAMCSTDLEVVDVFAVEGFRLIAGQLGDAGQTEITLAWEPSPAAPVTGYRVETAPEPDGPWAAVGTVAAGEQLFTHTLGEPAAWFRVVTESELGDGGATAPRRAFTVIDELYDIRDVPVPGVPFATTLYGVVRHPTALAEGPFPLVLALHGNHGNCRDPGNPDDDFCSTSNDHECAFPGQLTTPNAEGYDYFLDTLAAQGYVTVSISGNAMNCRDDYILERAQLIAEHLRRWSDWQDGNGELGGLFAGALDLGRVGLVGHSRGGDAVSNVPGVLAQTPIPGLQVVSVFAVAPTDFRDVVVRDTNLAVLLPACDGDVSDLQGHRHYDRSVAFFDGVEQAQVLYVGANHNFFNTEWRLSEWEFYPGTHPFCEPAADPKKLEQTRMLGATLGSWFGATLQEEATEAFVRAERPSPTAFDAWTQSDLDLRWSYASTERATLDDFTGPETPAGNDVGGANTFTDWFVWQVCAAAGCDDAYPHLRSSLRLLWEQGHVPLARFDLQGYDATAAGTLSFRVVSRLSSLNTGLVEQDFLVRVIDSAGNRAELPLSDVKILRHLYPQTNAELLEILETVRIPVGRLLEYEPVLDLGSLEALELEMTALDRSGSVIVTDLEFAQ
jgi:hypothetical protein